MNLWELPTSLEIGGVGFNIRTDFRVVLDVLKAFNDPDLEDEDKAIICLKILYEDFDKIPAECYNEAIEKALWFIDIGDVTEDKNSKPKPRLMDWEQDASLIIPAINKVLGIEIRGIQYLHWWTFAGAYMEIGEGLFSEVLNIRYKKIRGERLDKHEQKFYNENKKIIKLENKLSEEEQAEKERLEKLLG